MSIREGYDGALDALTTNDDITGWSLNPPRYGDVTVTVRLDVGEVQQVVTALRNRGDHRQTGRWGVLAFRFDRIASVLQAYAPAVDDDDHLPRPTHRVELTYADGHVETARFVAPVDAAFFASATTRGERAHMTDEHGVITNVKICGVDD